MNTDEPLASPLWERDASYQYYKHSPMARTTLGQQQVQGLDYAYTLQGWIKGVNSSILRPDKDIQAVKRYYYFLQETGVRAGHPCRQLRLRDAHNRNIQLQDLLTAEELERLLSREERFASYALRNRVIMSLLVYQALLPREIAALMEQVMLLYRYLTEVRPKLVKVEAPSDSPTGREGIAWSPPSENTSRISGLRP